MARVARRQAALSVVTPAHLTHEGEQGRSQRRASSKEQQVEAPRFPDGPSDEAESWIAADDATLLKGVRRGVEAAFAEFVTRYSPMLLGIARHRGLGRSDASTAVVDFLDASAMRLAESADRVPRSLPAYLAVSFRRRLNLDWRTAKRREALESMLATDVGRGTQRAIAETCSEYVIRLTSGSGNEGTGDDHDAGSTAELRERVALVLDNAVNSEERRLLGYLADRMPQREIAELLGITHGNARIRILRLRDRLAGIAREYINTLPAEEGIALARFLSRGPRRPTPNAGHARPPSPALRQKPGSSARGDNSVRNRGTSDE
jgi:RNA polymerase sigma factor (sigma-70 family)